MVISRSDSVLDAIRRRVDDDYNVFGVDIQVRDAEYNGFPDILGISGLDRYTFAEEFRTDIRIGTGTEGAEPRLLRECIRLRPSTCLNRQ